MSGGCRPGDLAVVVRSKFAENVGRFVRVIERAGAEWEWRVEALQPIAVLSWDGVKFDAKPGDCIGCYDRSLRPIRDGDGDDETLDWAGKPSQVNSLVEAR
jgi:hypothetical protein